MLGELNAMIITGGVTGLTWDDTAGALYPATRAGLSLIDLGSCDTFTCGNTTGDKVFRAEVALAWDPVTARIVRQGGDGFGVTNIDIIDPASGVQETTIGIDPYTIEGMAVPEPDPAVTILIGAAVLAALDRIRPRD
jgi:hypothetical protein